VAASHRAQALPSGGAGGSHDPARSRGRTDDLGPCRPGPAPAAPPRRGARVEIAQGKGNPEGNRRRTGTGQRPKGTNRRTPDEGEPAKADEGKNPAGKREAGGKPAVGTGGREVRPQTARARARGFGAARICDAAGSWRAARTAHGSRPLPGGPRGLAVACPARCAPRERRPASCAVRQASLGAPGPFRRRRRQVARGLVCRVWSSHGSRGCARWPGSCTASGRSRRW